MTLFGSVLKENNIMYPHPKTAYEKYMTNFVEKYSGTRHEAKMEGNRRWRGLSCDEKEKY